MLVRLFSDCSCLWACIPDSISPETGLLPLHAQLKLYDTQQLGKSSEQLNVEGREHLLQACQNELQVPLPHRMTSPIRPHLKRRRNWRVSAAG